MSDLLAVLAAPIVACLVLTGIHCYLGIHILMRGVIFVDLALAQIAALGAAVGLLVGIQPEGPAGYSVAFAFTLIGAFLFALGRFRDQRVPQEALIGIVYAVSLAIAILIFSKSGLDRDQVENMLVGRLLFVDWYEIMAATALYLVVVFVHVICRRPFVRISTAATTDQLPRGYRTWDFLFYATFGLVVTSSVKMAGVLLVFSLLIIPAACAALFYSGFGPRLIAGWLFGVLGSVLGIAASWEMDLPTGAAIVAAFGAVFGACTIAYAVRAILARSPAPVKEQVPEVPREAPTRPMSTEAVD